MSIERYTCTILSLLYENISPIEISLYTAYMVESYNNTGTYIHNYCSSVRLKW